MLPRRRGHHARAGSADSPVQFGEDAGGLGLVAAGGCDQHLPPAGVVPTAFDDPGPLPPVGYPCDPLACWPRPSIRTPPGTGRAEPPAAAPPLPVPFLATPIPILEL